MVLEPQLSDHLIARAAFNDGNARRVLVETLEPVVCGLARKLFNRLPHSSAQDVASELWLFLWCNNAQLLHKCLGAHQPAHYLLTALRRRCLDIGRRHQGECKYRHRLCPQPTPRNDPLDELAVRYHTDSAPTRRYQARLLWLACAQLSPRYRQVVMLQLNDELSPGLQAQHCGCKTVAALYKLRFAARQRLIELIASRQEAFMAADPTLRVLAARLVR